MANKESNFRNPNWYYFLFTFKHFGTHFDWQILGVKMINTIPWIAVETQQFLWSSSSMGRNYRMYIINNFRNCHRWRPPKSQWIFIRKMFTLEFSTVLDDGHLKTHCLLHIPMDFLCSVSVESITLWRFRFQHLPLTCLNDPNSDISGRILKIGSFTLLVSDKIRFRFLEMDQDENFPRSTSRT